MKNQAASVDIQPVVIVGFAFCFPGETGSEQVFWQALLGCEDIDTQIDSACRVVDEFLYKSTDFRAPEFERSIAWGSPAIPIQWSIQGDSALSAKDQQAKLPA